ncbi:MAG TPA: hypothetical protein VFR47_23450, partial [Anaerolineales bacterium]|nr:hypothetical protein [Anaerolineales bacterium]
MNLTKQRLGQLAFIIGALIIIILFIFAWNALRNQERQNLEAANTLQAANTSVSAQQLTAQADVETAQMQAKISRAKELAALSTAERDKDPILSYLLGLEAFRLLDIPGTRS